ncbi:MAG: FAD-binding oxidoreductase [Bradymonadia bacterium]
MSTHIIREREVLERFLVDESSYTGHAEGVVFVESAEQVAAVLKQASAEGTPITFSARRTSLTGAAIPEGGLVLALPEPSEPEMVSVDRDNARATAPAQVLWSDVELAAEAAGLFLPPDPTSRKTCSIGGSVACNASGARSFAHGPTGAWVEGLTVALTTGDVVKLRRGEHPPVNGHFHLDLPSGPLKIPAPGPRRADIKNSLGYATFPDPDLIDLFIGSEGTLGYIHEVDLRLAPGVEVFAALVFWDDLDKALSFVEQLQGTRAADHTGPLKPMSVEWFDRASLELAAARHPRFAVPEGAVAALFVEQGHSAAEADDVMEAWYMALLEAGVPEDEAYLRMPTSKAQLDAFRDFRHAVPESINALARQRGLRKLGTDLAYPAGWLQDMVAHYHAALADVPGTLGTEAAKAFEAEWGRPLPQTLDAAAFGHIGDNHLHVNMLPNDKAEAAAGKLMYAALAQHCAQAGGVISGEHGIGKSKRDLLAATLTEDQLEQMRAIKAVLDPAGILGVGNLFASR